MLSMMSGFPKKLILAAFAIYILLSSLPAGSSSVSSHGGERNPFGYQGANISDCMETRPTRSLKVSPSPPPPPPRNDPPHPRIKPTDVPPPPFPSD